VAEQRLNIALFRAVRDKIVAAPSAYDQGNEGYKTGESPCGTAACIGGWADILSAPNEEARAYRLAGHVDLDRAANALGLTGSNFWNEYAGDILTERAVLFTGDPDIAWPSPFAGRWARASDRDEQARIAVDYLNHIICTGRVFDVSTFQRQTRR
jgi:hypothetical protein